MVQHQVTVSEGGTIVERTKAFDDETDAANAYLDACARHPYRTVEIEMVTIKSEKNSYERRVVE